MKRPIFTLLFAVLLAFTSLSANAAEIIRILAIGNSFSEDAVEQNLREICASEGVSVVIGNLFIAACDIDRHVENIVLNAPAYRYRKIGADGKMTERNGATLQSALKDEKWDYITFQQASAKSGQYATYHQLGELLMKVRETVGPRPVFCWHMTWAYATNSTHAGFPAYASNQLNMFHAIEECAKLVMRDHPELKILIPAGTAIQNARTAMIAGDDLTRDGHHLELRVGRYVAACTWCAALFRRLLTDSLWRPKGVTPEQATTARDAAVLAVLHPWHISPLNVISSPHM